MYTENHAQVYLMKCHREKAGQEWIFDYVSFTFYLPITIYMKPMYLKKAASALRII